MVNEPRLVGLFKDLCMANSPSRQERASVDLVIKVLTDMGLGVSEDDAGQKIGGNAGNVTAWLKGNKEGAPRIFFSAHFDTVEPTEGLQIGEKDGVLFSESDTILGADDKGGMAPAIEAVRMLQESGAQHGDICLVFSVAEEVGLLGAGEVKIDEMGLDYGFVLDTGPPVGSFVTKTATHDKLDVVIRGKPAHSGKDPEKGINAIQVLADAVTTMRLGRISPNTTANFGLVEGGTAVNVVCPFVRVRGEARSTVVAELDEQISHMKAELERAAAAWGAKVEIDHERHYGAYSIPPESEVVRVGQAASRKLGFDPVLRETLGGSDANRFNAKGVPTVVCGTGMEAIHTHDEHIAVRDLVSLAELVYEIACEAAV